MKRLTVGILAHVDSGKTTLTEAMLYAGGEIRSLGRVDRKNAFLDNHELERERGITIFAKQAVLTLNDTEITLLDTPGHTDFSAETERTMSVLDYAILVISGTDGVQNHTETLWRLINRYKIPVFIFVNKTDISEKSRGELMSELQSRLGSECVDFSAEEEILREELALCSERLMQSFLENGSVSDEDISLAVSEKKAVPCCFGSALKLEGIDRFMDCLRRFTLSPDYREEFGARVFKISEDESGGRLTHLKVTGGVLKAKSLLGAENEKVNQIRIYSGAKYKTVPEAPAGTVCAVTGISKRAPGDGCGFERNAESPLLEPFLSYRAVIPEDADIHTVYGYFKKLCEEDPQLRAEWNEQLKEIRVRIMGTVQTEILKSIILQRFGIDIDFEMSGIVYKETIAKPAVGIGHYEPLRHYAEVHLLMEPLPAGSGLIFASRCREEILDKNWQRLILTHLKENTHIGVLTGSPITDMKISVAAGRAHLKHTEGGDFRQAVYRAVRHGLRCTESVLLEPWYDFKIEVPSANVGRVISDVQKMGGSFSPPETFGEMSEVKGTAPVSEMMDYGNEITGYTRGKGRIYCRINGYKPCHNSDEVIEKIGYDCDADTENTADSVFCHHGAGHTVSWRETAALAHADSGISFGEEKPEESPRRPSVPFKRAEASEKELMEIFERTYGPIKRNERQAMKTPKEAPPSRKNLNVRRVPAGPEYILVDGYNIIFGWEDLKKIAEDDLSLARSMLENMLCSYQGFRKCELILVFDAYKVKGAREVERSGGISIVYTKEAETADAYIEKTTHRLGSEHRVRVATSDNLEQMIILGNGAYRVSASEFRREVDAVLKEIKDFIG